MSTDTQNNAPVGAEPVAWVRRHPDGALTAEFLEHAAIEPVRKNSGAWVPLYTAPVAAQPGLTQQTLDDVMAGIPARDAEIEALRKENEQLRQAINRPVSAETTQPWAPEKCPITQRPFFMWIEHHKTGEMVPTYGGPYDSYTLAEYDGESFICERFDHDAGGWLVDCVEGLGVKLVDDQALVIDPNNTRYDEIEAFAAAPVAAQAQPDPRTPADMLVNGGALKLALNTLRRAGKNEIADELEKTATPAQRPVSGAEGLPPLPRGISKHSVIGHDADVYTDAHMVDYALAALAQMVEPRLDKPAKVGGSRFGVGIKWSTVITAAQRLYEYEVTPEKEAERIAGADQKMQALWHHIAAQAQQDASKVDAALAEMVHAMFRSANSIPVTRITIDRKQYEAAIDAARKEQA